MQVLNDILGYKDRKIFQDDRYFSFSLDSVMLANFVNIRMRDKKILDLGTGNAIIPLILSLRTNKKIVGVEIQNNLVQLAKKSVKYNNLEEQITIINSDMKDYRIDGDDDLYDIITCNPPYFKVDNNKTTNLTLEKTIARHEVKITLSDVFSVSKKLLKAKGIFALVHRSERLLEILNLFRDNDIEPKRLQFVYEKLKKSPTLVLIEGVKNGKPGLKVESPFVLYDEKGNMTEEYSNLLKEVKR